jgi:hypothetical protein
MEVVLNTLLELTADNPVQTDRLLRLQALQTEWSNYAQSMIDCSAPAATIPLRSRPDGQAPDRRNSQAVRRRDRHGAAVARHAQRGSAPHHDLEHHPVSVVHRRISGLLAYIGRRDLVSLSQSYVPTLLRSRPAPGVWSSRRGCATVRPNWPSRCWGN